jgi:hypothetical protein
MDIDELDIFEIDLESLMQFNKFIPMNKYIKELNNTQITNGLNNDQITNKIINLLQKLKDEEVKIKEEILKEEPEPERKRKKKNNNI